MADLGGDGISLRGLSGKRLKEQQEKDREELKKLLNDPIEFQKWLKEPEKDAKGGLVGRGQGKVNRIKITKTY